jgi:hypothetical protein
MIARFHLWQQKNRYGKIWDLPTEQYQHKSDDLWCQYQEGLIDHSSYVNLLEQLKDEEIDKEHKQNPFISKERLDNGIWKYEQFFQEAREKEAQRIAEEKRMKSLTPLEKYLEDTPGVIKNFRLESKSYRREANISQILIIVGSVLTTSASSAVVFGVNGYWRWIAPVISIVVTISAGLTAYFKFREKSFNLQQTADAIEQEYKAVKLGIGYYIDKKPQEHLHLFADRVELLIDEQKKRQQQLEQPPDIKHGHNHL